MKTRLSKLVSFYRDACEQGGSFASDGQVSVFEGDRSREVRRDYSLSTLRRLVYSRSAETRQAAVWALGWVGGASEYQFLGPWLRSEDPRLRFQADRSREQLLLRTRTDWQVQSAEQIEASMAESHWRSANRLVDRLVARHAEHPQSWLLRAAVRLCTSQLPGAIEDCRTLLSFDPNSYRACVFLGQCYWFMHCQRVAQECFSEAMRIYPDCTVTVD
jgi:tetratricopeptide (TPR) repeat protein